MSSHPTPVCVSTTTVVCNTSYQVLLEKKNISRDMRSTFAPKLIFAGIMCQWLYLSTYVTSTRCAPRLHHIITIPGTWESSRLNRFQFFLKGESHLHVCQQYCSSAVVVVTTTSMTPSVTIFSCVTRTPPPTDSRDSCIRLMHAREKNNLLSNFFIGSNSSILSAKQ